MCAHARGNDLAYLYSRAGMAQLVGGGGGQRRARSPPRAILYSALTVTVPCRPITTRYMYLVPTITPTRMRTSRLLHVSIARAARERNGGRLTVSPL